MLHRFFLAALLAGLVSGAVLTAAQAVRALTLIHEAETYETAAATHAATADAGHAHEDAAWQPAAGFERLAFTFLANLLLAIGLALVLVAAYAFFGPARWWTGFLWGLGGFAAFTLAPALGLPPELPGTEAAALGARQLWWALTVAATAGGLGLLAFAPGWPWKLVGAALVVLPHALGAPHPEQAEMAAPAELARAFVTASLLANLVFWLVLGPLSAWLFTKLVAPAIPVDEK